MLAVGFVFAGANIAIQGVFPATEGGVQSLLVSLLRQLIFVLPAAWLFARLLPAGVWLAFPIAEVLTAVIAAVLLRRIPQKAAVTAGSRCFTEQVKSCLTEYTIFTQFLSLLMNHPTETRHCAQTQRI